jgi:exopolysaccharide production protein ExoY
MATEPLKAVSNYDGEVPEYFYSAATVIENERYRWFMQDLDRISAELDHRFETDGWFRAQLVMKRAVDMAGSFTLIVLLAPVFLVTAIAVKLSSPGPIFYSHKRWAKGENHFVCLKFRSMRIDQDKVLDPTSRKQIETTGKLIKLKEDPRLTPIGSFIRKTSIDELPQLFNVLKGDMSLVGPRPLVLHMMQPYPKVRRVRCTFRPGISGLWQIRDRENNTSVIGMMPHDIEYLVNYSISLDAKILLATLPAVLWGTGAC